MTFSASTLAVALPADGFCAHVRQPVGRLVARVQDWFESFCPQLGFYGISSIFPALVRRDRPYLSHLCENGGGRLPATWGFVLGAYGKRALVGRR